MAKNKLVIFTANNARILINANPDEYPGALVNPDLSKVKGIVPHFWKLKDGKIVPMTAAEKKARLLDHELNGVDNDILRVSAKIASSKKKRFQLSPYWALPVAGALGYLAAILQGQL